MLDVTTDVHEWFEPGEQVVKVEFAWLKDWDREIPPGTIGTVESDDGSQVWVRWGDKEASRLSYWREGCQRIPKWYQVWEPLDQQPRETWDELELC